MARDGAASCAPCEGGDGPPQLAGKAGQLADIAGFYGAFGLVPSQEQPDVEDHIATELEFMSALAIREACALAALVEGWIRVDAASLRLTLSQVTRSVAMQASRNRSRARTRRDHLQPASQWAARSALTR